ncbi:MAG: DUF86 domain-containing protein [Lentisphaerae bacterium]|nr:DUF86 domain-containing protein [Lentisphaerota bacterium]
MPDDVTVNKADTIRRCLRRVTEEYRGDPARLKDFTIQDSIVLNLQRACEAAIDLAMHMVAARRLGVPQDARSAFALLAAAGVLSAETETRMKRMVGFRNIAVHDYRAIEMPVLAGILRHRLGDFEEFLRAVMAGV